MECGRFVDLTGCKVVDVVGVVIVVAVAGAGVVAVDGVVVFALSIGEDDNGVIVVGVEVDLKLLLLFVLSLQWHCSLIGYVVVAESPIVVAMDDNATDFDNNSIYLLNNELLTIECCAWTNILLYHCVNIS